MPPERLSILGVGISAINLTMARAQIRSWVCNCERHYVCVTGVHGVMESVRDESVRDIHNRAGLVTPDGMPLVWLMRWAGCGDVRRVYGPDLMLAILGDSDEAGYTHFLYGATVETLAALEQNVRRRFPSTQIVGQYAPPFRPLTREEDAAVTQEINASGATIVWVGLSTPKQERWMAEHRPRLEAPVLIGVGAAFDIHAGKVPQAPKWIQRSGLEWLFRLVIEPERLWRRYLVNNPSFLWLVAMQYLGWRKFPLGDSPTLDDPTVPEGADSDCGDRS